MRVSKRFFMAAILLGLAAAMGGAATTLAGLSQKDNDKSSPAAGALAPDKGKFRMMLDGQVVGSEEFEISSSSGTWTVRGSTTLRVPGGADVKATGQLKCAADGTPIRYEWSAQSQKKASGVVNFSNGIAETSTDLGGKTPFTQEFTFPSPRVVVLDDNLYHQYAMLARLYDWKAGGKQEFPVLIPQDLTPGSISVESLGSQQVESAKYETLRVSSPDLEILLYLDAGRRLMRLDVPASKVTILRE